MFSMRGNEEERLDTLFRAYRQACPPPEASANFMPALWGRIEARQSVTFSFRRMASGFVTAALALTIALGIYMAVPRSNQAFLAQTYVDVLEPASSDSADVINPVHLDLPDPGR